MANFTTTLNNPLTLFGLEDTNKWGAITWGVSKWGNGDNFLPLISVQKILQAQLVVLSETAPLTAINHLITINDSLICSGDMFDERLQDANGYYYNFGTSENLEDRPFVTYVEVGGNVTSYTTATNPVTVWSEQ